MKTINYFWYGLTRFVEGYVPFFSMVTSIATAFAIAVFFPVSTLIVLFVALFVGGVLAKRQISKAHKQDRLFKELEEQIEHEIAEKIKLKTQYQHNKEHIEHLVALINRANHHKLTLRKAHAYCDHLSEKIRYMHHNERKKFLDHHSCQQINKILPHLQNAKLSEHEFEKQTNHLEKYSEPWVQHAEMTIFADKYKLHTHYDKKMTIDTYHKKTVPVISGKFQPSKLGSAGIAIKTSLLTFGFTYSMTAITASIITTLSPILLIASFPITAITVALGLMAFAVGLGVAAGVIYHKNIAPRKAQLISMTEKLPSLIQKNNELLNKLSLEKTIIEEQRQHLKEIEEDNHLMHMQVMHKAESLHKELDYEYHQAHKVGVKKALHIANHPKIKDEQPKPIPATTPSDNELSQEILNEMSLEVKKTLRKPLQDNAISNQKKENYIGG